jgi:hypothetical protein
MYLQGVSGVLRSARDTRASSGATATGVANDSFAADDSSASHPTFASIATRLTACNGRRLHRIRIHGAAVVTNPFAESDQDILCSTTFQRDSPQLLRLGGDLTVPIVGTNFVQKVAAADRCGARVHTREDRRIWPARR